MADAVFLVGIDEAGYGPILGPLTVSAVAFEVPRDFADESLWSLLKASVSKTASVRGSRIPILDSKKLHKPQEGIARLERSALAAVGAWRGHPPTLRALLSLISPDTIGRLGEYSWYRAADPAVPGEADAGAIRIAATMLRQEMESRGIRIAGLWSEVLLEGHYNRLVTTTQNKAVVLLGLTLRLMQRAADTLGGEIRFFIDKQGAREHYGPMLLRSFEDRRLKVITEEPGHSAYEMVDGRTRWQVSFSQSGESRQMPTALASIMSKYLRELFMGVFNDFWSLHVPALRRTAGYYEDGHRFLADITPHLSRLGITRESLIRAR